MQARMLTHTLNSRRALSPSPCPLCCFAAAAADVATVDAGVVADVVPIAANVATAVATVSVTAEVVADVAGAREAVMKLTAPETVTAVELVTEFTSVSESE